MKTKKQTTFFSKVMTVMVIAVLALPASGNCQITGVTTVIIHRNDGSTEQRQLMYSHADNSIWDILWNAGQVLTGAGGSIASFFSGDIPGGIISGVGTAQSLNDFLHSVGDKTAFGDFDLMLNSDDITRIEIKFWVQAGDALKNVRSGKTGDQGLMQIGQDLINQSDDGRIKTYELTYECNDVSSLYNKKFSLIFNAKEGDCGACLGVVQVLNIGFYSASRNTLSGDDVVVFDKIASSMRTARANLAAAQGIAEIGVWAAELSFLDEAMNNLVNHLHESDVVKLSIIARNSTGKVVLDSFITTYYLRDRFIPDSFSNITLKKLELSVNQYGYFQWNGANYKDVQFVYSVRSNRPENISAVSSVPEMSWVSYPMLPLVSACIVCDTSVIRCSPLLFNGISFETNGESVEKINVCNLREVNSPTLIFFTSTNFSDGHHAHKNCNFLFTLSIKSVVTGVIPPNVFIVPPIHN